LSMTVIRPSSAPIPFRPMPCTCMPTICPRGPGCSTCP
jgi:hypothetical protein